MEVEDRELKEILTRWIVYTYTCNGPEKRREIPKGACAEQNAKTIISRTEKYIEVL